MRRPRLYSVLFWFLWVVICLLAQGRRSQSSHFAIAAALGTYVLPIVLYSWCKADSSARAVQPPPGAIPLLAVLLPLGWAYYVCGTRSPLRAFALIVGAAATALGIMGAIGVLLGPVFSTT